MLVELDSDAFFHDERRPGPFRFQQGLNTVLGTENTENSIGKSTTLLVIDFCFGGHDYIDKAKDVVKNVGHHEIRFAFLLGGETHYFRRATETPNIVTLCDSEYRALRTMTLDDFTNFLGTQYGLVEAGSTLRFGISNFFRIWQRKNVDVDHPLFSHRSDTLANGVKRLLCLYDQYHHLESFIQAADTAKHELDVFNAAGRYYDFPRAQNVTQIRENRKQIDELTKQRDQAGAHAGLTAKEYTPAQQAAIDEIRARRLPLQRRLNQINRQLASMKREKGLDKDVKLTKKFDALLAFFPEINQARIEGFEHFHHNLRSILESEYKAESKELEAERERITGMLAGLDARLKELSVAPTAKQADLRAYSDLDRQIRRLIQANQSYDKHNELKGTKDKTAKELKENSASILADLEHTINDAMERIDGEITSDTRTPPRISICSVDKYSYEIEDDSGTGCTQRGVVSFDLSLLETSLLPAIAHDTMLVQPIEDQAFDGIVSVYARQTKQVFLAIDKISRYSPQTQEILEATKFVHLQAGRELFGRSWSKKKKKRKKK